MIETKPKRRWFTVSLRTLLLVMTVLYIRVGIQDHAVGRQREAVYAILNAGGYEDFRFGSRTI